MKLRCGTYEAILAVIILAFVFIGGWYSDWIIAISAVLLLVHSLTCRDCTVPSSMPRQSRPATRRKSRRR